MYFINSSQILLEKIMNYNVREYYSFLKQMSWKNWMSWKKWTLKKGTVFDVLKIK